MTTKLENMDENLILILEQMLSNQNLCKYVYYNSNDPLSEVNISDTSKLILNRFYPSPFNVEAKTDNNSEVRIYYSTIDIEDIAIDDLTINFDVIVSKDLWLMNNKRIRPYRILNEIIKCFPKDKSIGTLGKLKFGRGRHLMVNDKFDAFQVTATIWQIGK